MFKFLKKLWDVLRVILVVVLVCLAIWFTCGGAAIALFGTTFVGFSAALLCVGVAYIVDPDTTKQALTAVADAAATVATTIASTVLDVVADTVTSSKLFLYGAAGLAAWFLLGGKKKKDDDAEVPKVSDDGAGDGAFVGPMETA